MTECLPWERGSPTERDPPSPDAASLDFLHQRIQSAIHVRPLPAQLLANGSPMGAGVNLCVVDEEGRMRGHPRDWRCWPTTEQTHVGSGCPGRRPGGQFDVER